MARVQTENRLGIPKLAREDARLVGNSRIVRVAQNSVGPGCARGCQAWSERGVERVLEVVLESIVSNGATEIVRPAGEKPASSSRRGEIQHVGCKLWKEAVRIYLGPIPRARWRPEVSEAGAFSRTVPAKRVQTRRRICWIEWKICAAKSHEILRRAISPVMIGHGDRIVLGDELAVDDCIGITRN